MNAHGCTRWASLREKAAPEEVWEMKWICLNRAGLLGLLVISLSACAANGGLALQTTPPTPYPPPGFAHEVSSPAVRLFWNCTRPTPDTLALEGLAFNPWSGSEIRFLQFELAGVDSREATVSEVSGPAQSLIFGMRRSTPFQLALPTRGSEIRFDPFYQYQYQEPGEGGGDGGHRSRLPEGVPSVRLVSSTPLLPGPATQRFMVRDACSETMHRAR